MRIIAKSRLKLYWETPGNEKSQPYLNEWYHFCSKQSWAAPQDIKDMLRNVSFVANERVVFNVKGNDYRMLKDLVKSKVKSIVCLGKDNKSIHEAFEDDVEVIVNTFSANEAVQIAYHLAKKGDTVLLSPACASFDLFKNYEDRGNQFKKAVKEL